MIETRQFTLFVFILALAATGHAQMSPASLGNPDAERNLIRLIEFPETHGDATVKLQCLAILKASGKMKDAGCYVNNNWEPVFAEAVQKAAKKAILTPARDSQKGQVVALMFRVEFLKKKDEKSITVYLNPGVEEMIEEYGPKHISAQRVMGKERWKKSCPSHASWLVQARAHVNEEGQASSVELAHARGIVPTGQCQRAVIDTLTESLFVPTMVDGVAVPGSYVEPFGS